MPERFLATIQFHVQAGNSLFTAQLTPPPVQKTCRIADSRECLTANGYLVRYMSVDMIDGKIVGFQNILKGMSAG